MNPYTEKRVTPNKVIRTFSSNVPNDELLWHRDQQRRRVRVITSDNWQFQYEDELPIPMEPGTILEIPAMEYHRIIKGNGDLVVEIQE
jgi:hypothetical protein